LFTFTLAQNKTKKKRLAHPKRTLKVQNNPIMNPTHAYADFLFLTENSFLYKKATETKQIPNAQKGVGLTAKTLLSKLTKTIETVRIR